MSLLYINTFTIWTIILNTLCLIVNNLQGWVKVSAMSMLCSVMIYGNLLIIDHGEKLAKKCKTPFLLLHVFSFFLHVLIPGVILYYIYYKKCINFYSTFLSFNLALVIGVLYVFLLIPGITFNYHLPFETFFFYFVTILITTYMFIIYFNNHFENHFKIEN